MPVGLFTSCKDANSLMEQIPPLCNKTMQVIKNMLAGLQTGTLSINSFSGAWGNGWWRFCFIWGETDLMDTWIRAEPVGNHIEFNIVLFSAMKYPLGYYSILKELILNQGPAALCFFCINASETLPKNGEKNVEVPSRGHQTPDTQLSPQQASDTGPSTGRRWGEMQSI